MIMNKNKLVVYQINPRMFTPQGTLGAAKQLLPHIASMGVNVAYVFAICKEEDSKDRHFWSKRQKKSKTNNPKNPYRIADYFEVDEEFGGNEQLKEFVEEAHRLGLYVMLDLVYMHCAPNAKLIEAVPDGVYRDENGEVKLGPYKFPLLNFGSRALREYLIENMRYFIREYDIDGYRCDVGDAIPLDFWQEAVEEIKKLKPDILMLNEGAKIEYVESGVFDLNYHGFWALTADKNICDYIKTSYGERKCNGIWFVENHDTVTDVGRVEHMFSSKICDCLYTYIFTTYGTPLLYCGEEIADKNAHNMFANKGHNPGNFGIDWSNALLPDGKRRMALIKKLAALRKTEDVLAYGNLQWLETEKDVLGFERIYNDEKVTVLINFDKKSKMIEVKGNILLSRGYKDGKLSSAGFVIYKENK